MSSWINLLRMPAKQDPRFCSSKYNSTARRYSSMACTFETRRAKSEQPSIWPMNGRAPSSSLSYRAVHCSSSTRASNTARPYARGSQNCGVCFNRRVWWPWGSASGRSGRARFQSRWTGWIWYAGGTINRRRQRLRVPFALRLMGSRTNSSYIVHSTRTWRQHFLRCECTDEWWGAAALNWRNLTEGKHTSQI